jgi:hypothetical protein
MGFIIEAIIDWFWVGFMLRLRERHPILFWVLIGLQLALLASIIGLVIYLANFS